MKIDPYFHKERYFKWKERAKEEGIGGITKENSDLILKYVEDMEHGINIASGSAKGSRSHIRLNTIRIHLKFFAIKFKKIYGLNDMTNINEEQLCRFFSEMRAGIIKREDDRDFVSTGYYAKNFKAFWHWWMKVTSDH